MKDPNEQAPHDERNWLGLTPHEMRNLRSGLLYIASIVVTVGVTLVIVAFVASRLGVGYE